MSNYRRNFVAGGCYFFTVNLLERQRSLLTDHIDLLRDSVRRVKRLYPFHIDAWVVLPDHMHSTAWMQEVEQRRSRSSCRACGRCRRTLMIFLCVGG